MSDRELLERAANAACLRVEWLQEHECFWIALGQGLECRPWLPLTDDGDGARLEAACMLGVEWQTQHVIVGRTMLDKWQEPYVLHDGDKQAARRFAAVRAAAAQASSLSQEAV